MKKYELTDDSITFMGRKLFRIRAIRSFNDVTVGDLGGYIEKEENLSHDDDAWISGNARIFANAQVFGNAQVSGSAWIFDNAQVSGNAWIFGSAEVSGNAQVCDGSDYLCFQGLGSKTRNMTFFKCKDGHIHVSYGWFSRTIQEFENKVKETHNDSKYAKEYLACIELVKIHFEEEKK